jgi:hypothetical protein
MSMTTRPHYRVVSYHCDIPMRRSKEQCVTPSFHRWVCTGKCMECICCVVKDETGDEHHIGANKWKAKNI